MSLDDEIKKLQAQRKKGISMSGVGELDSSIYGDGTDKSSLLQYIADEEDEDGEASAGQRTSSSSTFRAEMVVDEEGDGSAAFHRQQSGSGLVNTRISDRESEVRILLN
jgi:hypothetical protein